jgi:hypothetical protein
MKAELEVRKDLLVVLSLLWAWLNQVCRTNRWEYAQMERRTKSEGLQADSGTEIQMNKQIQREGRQTEDPTDLE